MFLNYLAIFCAVGAITYSVLSAVEFWPLTKPVRNIGVAVVLTNVIIVILNILIVTGVIF